MRTLRPTRPLRPNFLSIRHGLILCSYLSCLKECRSLHDHASRITHHASSNMKKLNVGLIGYGFMGRTHSNAFRKVNNFFDVEYQPVLKAVCARSADKAKAFAENWGYQSIETDWRKLIARNDIDLIDIGSPNNTHAEIAIAAAK